MKQIQSHILDLTQIDGNGEFLCPECGNGISPDDCTEEEYSILEIRMETENLNEVIVQCKKCATTIHLTGFSLLQKLSNTKIKNSNLKRRKRSLLLSSYIISSKMQ
jgi:hypothetical protein